MIGSPKVSSHICKTAVLTKEMSERRWEAECSYPARRTVSLTQSYPVRRTVSLTQSYPAGCMASIDQSYKPQRRVSLDHSVEINYIPARSDMSVEEIHDVWYNEFEKRRIRRDYNRILKKIVAGTYNYDIDCLESESRGLEMNTSKEAVNDALCAVLDEQDRQEAWFGRIVDHRRIAEASRKSSSQCQEKAHQIAAKDAKLVSKSKALTFENTIF